MAVKCRVLQSGVCAITCGYGNGHKGIDLVDVNSQGTHILGWIVAHSDGIVVELRTNCKGYEGNGSYGNYVKLKHDDGYYTLYAHMSYGTIKVKKGQRVSRKQVLGYMGATGFADGGHLHWELRTPNDVRIDPTPYLDKDLPNNEHNYTGTITYQAYTNKWLPEVKKCDNTNEGYAGIYNEPITAFRCKPQYGEIIYKAGLLGGEWLEEVNSKDYSKNNGDSFAGILGKPIDRIMIKSTKGYVDYRVKTKKGWLPWVRQYNDYAGNIGEPIIGIQMK